MHHTMGDLRIGGMGIRYSQFVPKLYNYCRSLGFERNRMMPSHAFCSDESRGYPVILLAQHFGTFPFDHGQVGGKVATDRHGPHAHHGEDLLLLLASHVGYDAETQSFGVYRRSRTRGGWVRLLPRQAGCRPGLVSAGIPPRLRHHTTPFGEQSNSP